MGAPAPGRRDCCPLRPGPGHARPPRLRARAPPHGHRLAAGNHARVPGRTTGTAGSRRPARRRHRARSRRAGGHAADHRVRRRRTHGGRSGSQRREAHRRIRRARVGARPHADRRRRPRGLAPGVPRDRERPQLLGRPARLRHRATRLPGRRRAPVARRPGRPRAAGARLVAISAFTPRLAHRPGCAGSGRVAGVRRPVRRGSADALHNSPVSPGVPHRDGLALCRTPRPWPVACRPRDPAPGRPGAPAARRARRARVVGRAWLLSAAQASCSSPSRLRRSRRTGAGWPRR